MANVLFDSGMTDDQRRARVFAGDVFIYSPNDETLALVALARRMLEEAAGSDDPRTLHRRMSPEELARLLAELKPRFIHHPACKILIPSILRRFGCDPDRVYFDVPRLRTAYPKGHLNSGIAYAYHPHRDTWYSAPRFQTIWWLPVYPLSAENCMALHPHYFDLPIENDSEIYDYARWKAVDRPEAARHVRFDARRQPRPATPVQGCDLRLIPPPGGVIVFSAAHLHATVENTSGVARYSIDFRAVHIDDAENGRGAPNVDSRCSGTTLRDFKRASDLAGVPESVARRYDGTEPVADALHRELAEAT